MAILTFVSYTDAMRLKLHLMSPYFWLHLSFIFKREKQASSISQRAAKAILPAKNPTRGSAAARMYRILLYRSSVGIARRSTRVVSVHSMGLHTSQAIGGARSMNTTLAMDYVRDDGVNVRHFERRRAS